jgi:hypothetical protein
VAVLDIDGVVADVRHRLHHLDPPRSWQAFFAAAGADGLLLEGARLARELAGEHDIAWLSGRPEWLRPTTTEWLERHQLPAGVLVLRPNRDRRPARLFKIQALGRLAPRGVAAFVDDDDEVVDAALRAGYPAVLADWMPREDVLRTAQDRLGRT